MSSFRRELLPPASTFYNQEFELSRPSRGWARTACPFHGGSNPTAFSVNVTTGGFFCFNCSVKGGDIIDYVMLRDNVDFITAAKSLGAWSQTDSTTAQQIARDREARERRRCDEEQRKAEERRKRIEARDWLHVLERVREEASAHLAKLQTSNPDDPKVEVCWGILSDVLPQIRYAAATYYLLSFVGESDSVTDSRPPHSVENILASGLVRDGQGHVIEVSL